MSSYTRDYQPTYPDTQHLDDVLAELKTTEPVTTPDNIEVIKSGLAEVATGRSDRQIVIVGPCAEPINLTDSIEGLAKDYMMTVDIASSQLDKPLVISRSRGQSTKPRSSEYETLPDGRRVLSYYGDMVNGLSEDQRTPDPSRMIAGAIQSRDVEEVLSATSGHHVPAAHEALLLPYERSFVREDEATGKQYLLSTDLPWIGERTNGADSPQTELLSQVENPVGIKLGPSASEEQIAELADALNPSGEAGKLVFMPRMGLEGIDSLPRVLKAIKQRAPNSLIVCDPMHGNTRSIQKTGAGKVKTRVVKDIIEEIRAAAEACQEQGLRLHGVHLEASGKADREECVDEPKQSPRDKSVVDPELNNRQLQKVLKELAKL